MAPYRLDRDATSTAAGPAAAPGLPAPRSRRAVCKPATTEPPSSHGVPDHARYAKSWLSASNPDRAGGHLRPGPTVRRWRDGSRRGTTIRSGERAQDRAAAADLAGHAALAFGWPRDRAAGSPPGSDWPRCTRTAASSHRHRSAEAVSSPSQRGPLSNSTVSYGLPDVCGPMIPSRPAALAGSTLTISAITVTEPDTGRLSSRRCLTSAWAHHRDSGAASGCAGSISSSRWAPTSSRPAICSPLCTRSTKPTGVQRLSARNIRYTPSNAGPAGTGGRNPARRLALPHRHLHSLANPCLHPIRGDGEVRSPQRPARLGTRHE